MRAWACLIVVAAFVAGCSGVNPDASASPDAASPRAAADPTAGGLTGTVAGPAVEGFRLCTAGTPDAPCPLEPASYMTQGHDAVALTIADQGWQEDPAVEHPTVILSRVDAADQLLSIDLGDTGPLLSDTDLGAIVMETATSHVGSPQPVTVGGASGYSVELAPTEAGTIAIPGAASHDLEPGRTYRLFVLQYPMGEESIIVSVLVEAPSADFATFDGTASTLLETAQFSSGN